MPGALEGERFPPCLRLRSRAEFGAVFTRRIRASDGHMTLYAAPNAGGGVRLGIAVSRRTGNAVFRNRIKRRVREVFRRHRKELPGATDYVVVPRHGQNTSFKELLDAFVTLSARLRPMVDAARHDVACSGGGGEPLSECAKRKHQVP